MSCKVLSSFLCLKLCFDRIFKGDGQTVRFFGWGWGKGNLIIWSLYFQSWSKLDTQISNQFRRRSTPVSTVLQKLVRFFIINIFLIVTKNLSQCKCADCQGLPCSVHYNMEIDLDEILNLPNCKASSEENGTGQYPV